MFREKNFEFLNGGASDRVIDWLILKDYVGFEFSGEDLDQKNLVIQQGNYEDKGRVV